jgi:PTS system nitrogen regulatory IIA component
MKIAEFIAPERVAIQSKVGSKKRALELVSALIAGAQPSLMETEIFDCLLARERLGSTGIGHGIAIPHGRLKSVDRPIGAFAVLEKGVDFDALDGEPADLVCALVVPAESTEEHLQILASLAALFSDEHLRERLRRAVSADELYALLTNDEVAPSRRAGSTT